MMMLDEARDGGACIKVIGVGGGGGNAVNDMVRVGVEGVQLIAANTDKQALADNLAEVRIQIGEQKTHGLGAGSNPSIGQEAAQESASIIQEELKGADMVFVTAGMGGGTGTGAAPVIAGIARQLGALTIGVVTKPFKFEGSRRRRQAEEGIENLRKNVDTLITIPNQRLTQVAGEQLTLIEAFKMADSVLVNAVLSISDLITKTGLVNTDFADVSTVMRNKGLALMGTGIGTGPERAIDAAEAAISSPLLDDISLEGATDVLLNITAPISATLTEIAEAAERIEEATSPDVHLIWGHVLNEDESSEEFKVTIIATGFGMSDASVDDHASDKVKRGSNFLDSYNSGSGYPSQARASSMGIPAAQSAAFATAHSAAYPAAQSASYPAASNDFQDMSSGSMDIAQNLQKSLQDSPDRSYQEPIRSGYAPTGNTSYTMTANNNYAPTAGNSHQNQRTDSFASVPDILAEIQKPVTSAKSNTSAQAARAISTAESNSADGYNLDEDMEIPTFLRKNPNKKNFLD